MRDEVGEPTIAFHFAGHQPEELAPAAFDAWRRGAGRTLPPAVLEVAPDAGLVREGFIAGFQGGWRARSGGGGPGPTIEQLLEEVARLRRTLQQADDELRRLEHERRHQQDRVRSALAALEHGVTELHRVARD